jgi:hypothetical protein
MKSHERKIDDAKMKIFNSPCPSLERVVPRLAATMLVCAMFAVARRGEAAAQTDGDQGGIAAEQVAPSESADSVPGIGVELPWLKKKNGAFPLPAQRSMTARQLLINIDDSELARLQDGQPLNSDDEETITRILYRLPAFALDDVERLQQKDVSLGQLAAEPANHRVEIFRIAGRVQLAERVELLPEAAERLEYDHYFQVAVEPDDADFPVLVCARKIPGDWPTGRPLNQPASFFGLLLKVGDTSGPKPQLVFAANRVAWHPAKVDPNLNVSTDNVLLASAGFDVGLFDEVRRRNRKEIGGADRECFYQMLVAAGKLDQAEVRRQADGKFELAPLLQQPENQHGRLMSVFGNARRITKIVVEDRDIKDRFHIDHYYQIDVFVPLGDQVVRLGKEPSDADGPIFTNSFPVTVCVLELPSGLTAEAELNESVSIPAFFFKLWAYKSGYVSSFNKDQLQLSPMFIGSAAELVVQQRTSNPWIGLIAGLLFLAVLAGTWYGLWRYNRGDRQFERTTLKRQFELEKGKSLDEMGIESQDKPDFRGLD